jgi:lysozyme
MKHRPKTLAACVGLACAGIVAPFVSTWESGGKQHLTAYQDIVGVWTICDGITKGVRAGQVETAAGCLVRQEEELIAHAEPVLACAPGLRGRPHQLAASVSLAYNIGTAGFCRSSAAKHFNQGNVRGGCDALLAFNKATYAKPQRGLTCVRRTDGKGYACVVRGLDRRRKAERALCLTGVAA